MRLLAVLWALFLFYPLLASNSYAIGLGVMFCINLMLIASLNLIMGYCGQISLCHGGFFGLGAYVSGVLSAKYGVSAPIGIAAAVMLTGCASLLIALPALRLRGHYLAMATLGFNAILSVLFVELVGLTGGPNGLSGIEPIVLAGFSFDTDVRFFYLAWLSALVVMAAILNLTYSRIGRAVVSLSGNEIGASSLGVNTYGLKVQIFVVSATVAAFSGSLFAHFNLFASPETFSFFTSVLLVVMVAVGGWGKYWGALFGALVFTLVPEYLRAFHDVELLVFGLSMIVVLMFFPDGLAGMTQRALAFARARIRPMLSTAPKEGPNHG
ncbi:branched-chain amino acid ABC transporter permease [Pusillimonas noertemannii]|uniref:branched-chain amino acid ABC transporter permease n=1 Tax=Pusillimonas noertemannii TaxID=305977 RepID=UPI00334042C4